jgi:hypothetical protein
VCRWKIPFLMDMTNCFTSAFLHINQCKMKKLIVLAPIAFVSVMNSFSQIRIPERTTPIKMTPTTTTTVAPTNLIQGKDLSVSIKSFQYDPANGGSLSATYVIRNNGTEAVDLNRVTLQGYIENPSTLPTPTPADYPLNGKNYYPAGGTSLATFSTMLKGGEQIERVIRNFDLSKKIYLNTSTNCSYVLMVDRDNIVNEANESNNIVTQSFRGYAGQYQPTVNPNLYYLTGAFLKIKTGSDSKEMESEVNIRLIPSTIKNLNDLTNEFVKKIAKNEKPLFPNLTETLMLLLNRSSTYTLQNPATSLTSFSLNGMGLVIEYKPNLFTDAWKIDQVEVVLHFKDANDYYHPTQGVITIPFTMPANTFLDGFAKRILVCKADGNFNPVSIKTIERVSAY